MASIGIQRVGHISLAHYLAMLQCIKITFMITIIVKHIVLLDVQL